MTHHPTQKQLDLAESALGRKLPPGFIEYYAKSKWHLRAGMNVAICSIAPRFDYEPDIVESNVHLRDKQIQEYPLPDFLVCFDVSAAIDDDFACFDTRRPDQQGEYPVVYWSREEAEYYEFVERDTGKLCVVDTLRDIAPDFASYLYNLVKNEIDAEELVNRRRERLINLTEQEKRIEGMS